MATQGLNAESAVLNSVPAYILEHASLLHLHSKDPYRPSSIAAQLVNTHPKIDSKPIDIPIAPLTLENLDQLNTLGKGGEDVYLTSNDDITTKPRWLEGQDSYGKDMEKTGVIVVVEKEGGIVDAFYFYFWAFNWGGVVLEKQLGDHVGDWEHTMIRFVNGIPKYIWLSQHANGEAFTFDALKKDATGQRPIVFAATGSHALYATSGTHDHTIPNFNLSTPFLLVDETDAGPLYDPLTTSYFYKYTPPTEPTNSANTVATGVFTAYHGQDPVGFLRFEGRWGDAEYPEDDESQKGKGLLGFKKYVGGPTGVTDKQLDRKEVWPENDNSKGQRIRTSIDGSTWWKDVLGKIKGKIGKKSRRTKKVNVSGEEVK